MAAVCKPVFMAGNFRCVEVLLETVEFTAHVCTGCYNYAGGLQHTSSPTARQMATSTLLGLSSARLLYHTRAFIAALRLALQATAATSLGDVPIRTSNVVMWNGDRRLQTQVRRGLARVGRGGHNSVAAGRPEGGAEPTRDTRPGCCYCCRGLPTCATVPKQAVGPCSQVLPIAEDTVTIRSLDWDRDRFDIEFG